ncbi:SOS response-associated peptidase [Salipiger sp. 1_MG-2023]|uniref:SOS response-associated peptidase n=1 Tax=Salipiger sp. 1_MG-2023 TaxID=3062665 RepID=UPI0026E2E5DE|nr:SOS response-associated peptidase [Salipiger sp. 1_MG-2023]MDO6585366.1 SOS response-associated peptidase [Salipiger sp. 1_MG-2023]
MCGRYAITLAPEAMAQMFDAAPANDLPPVPNFNVCPTVQVATVRSADGLRSLAPMRWGFVPHWYKTLSDGPLLINARAETLAEKPAFRAAARARRCLIPASGYYEWTKDADGKRLPWYIHPTDETALVFAAIWQDWEVDGAQLRTCAIVTTQAQGAMAEIHHRMPVILRPEDWPLWLGETGHGAARLMQPAPEGSLRWHRVASEVNSNRASGPQLIRPL